MPWRYSDFLTRFWMVFWVPCLWNLRWVIHGDLSVHLHWAPHCRWDLWRLASFVLWKERTHQAKSPAVMLAMKSMRTFQIKLPLKHSKTVKDRKKCELSQIGKCAGIILGQFTGDGQVPISQTQMKLTFETFNSRACLGYYLTTMLHKGWVQRVQMWLSLAETKKHSVRWLVWRAMVCHLKASLIFLI